MMVERGDNVGKVEVPTAVAGGSSHGDDLLSAVPL
jgi:hypothetical protein